MWSIFFSILFMIIIISLFVILFYALKRIEDYENFILQISQIIEYATTKVKQVDSAGHYEADDETGFFFEQLKELQLSLNNIFETEKESNAKKNKEKE